MNNTQKSKQMQGLIDWGKAIKMYEEGSSITSVARAFNVKYDFMRVQLMNRGVRIRKGRESHVKDRKYQHFNIFEPLTNEGAYLLGWLLADGNLSQDGQVRIYLEQTDKVHIDYLRSLVTTSPLREEYREKHDKHYYGFGFKNADIYDSLVALGLTPRKSFNVVDINWELIKEGQVPYVLLGLLEGDGHIAKNSNTVSIIMYLNTWLYVDKFFLSKLGIEVSSLYHDERWNMKELVCPKFTGEGYFNLLTSLYLNTPDVKHLPRKKERFIENCRRVANSKSTHRKIAENCLQVVKG